MSLHIVIAAGGTGGHMIPGHAVALELTARGHEVTLVTDDRGMAYPGLFPSMPKHVIASASPNRSGFGAVLHTVRSILEGKAASKRLYASYKPAVVAGFGGYPALPAMWGALSAKVPTLIHEQNAVLGRANRLLATRVDRVAASFAQTRLMPARAERNLVVTGNPVRPEFVAMRAQAFPAFHEDSVFRVLVIGGSQGARILSDVVPGALDLLPVSLRRRLQVTQQCRPEDIEGVRATYARLNIAADLATYMEDIPERLKWAHLVIARSGASTLAEITAAGRPAILVPLPTAVDDHQTANCQDIVAAGGARMIRQSAFTPVEVAKQIQKIALEPGALVNAAARARGLGVPDAAARLADEIEMLGGRTPTRVQTGDMQA